MMEKRISKRGFKGAVFGIFLILTAMLGGILPALPVYAEPEASEVVDIDTSNEETENAEETGSVENATGETETSSTANTTETVSEGDRCLKALSPIGWIVCSVTEKVASATDWLYDKIESFLIINPIETKDGTPIYEIWKYCRGVTNVVFIIFLLVVIYSQITGLGITNYGIKKILPKLIVVAVLVNLSFLICSLAVDVSNILGSSLRGIFTTVQDTALTNMAGAAGEISATDIAVSQAELYSAFAGGTALTIGGTAIAIETGAIWMIIPMLLGAIVSVVTGFITIAMRQALVALLIMISPLAIVAYMLPNTEQWFKKWKDLLMRMLVFYPMFAVLFGASQLAGFAIIASSKDLLGVILGLGVQIFPLFFSWKLMKMSGTILGTINEGMQKLMATPLAANRAWADSHRQLTKANHLAAERAITPSQRLAQYLADRQTARETEISEKKELIKNRGLAYKARLNYDKRGIPTRAGEDAYRDLARNMEYQRIVARDKNNMNKGLGQLEAIKLANMAQKMRLSELDTRVVNAADFLNVEQARGEMIEYGNAKGRHKRLEAAMNAHMDELNGYIRDENGKLVRNGQYKLHLEPGSSEFTTAMDRYSNISQIMEGNVIDAQFAAAKAATSYDTQKKIIENAYQKYFELTPPTKDVEYRLGELTKMKNAAEYIDTIIPGLRILNQRGDTDLVGLQLDNVLTGGKNGRILTELSNKAQEIKANAALTKEEIDKQIKELYANAGFDEIPADEYKGVQLGTHASQALAGFLMFDVKDNDPFLRRFGKYINLETANAFNANKRQEMNVTLEEYIKGYHEEPNGERMYAKKPMIKLLEGTSLDNPERTFYANMDESIMAAYGWDKNNPDKEWDVSGWLSKRKEVFASIMPQFISANLKYLSGSEQISSAVKSLTGYGSEPIKNEHGEVVDSTLSEPIWKKKYFKGHEEEVKKAFQDTVKSYIESQTPTQVSGLRTDYRRALAQHLSEEMLGLDDSKLSPEGIAARNEYAAELAEIQTRYGDLPPEEAARKRAEDERALREKIGSDEFLRLLDARGKLKHIYTSKRYGAGNMKDWERTWLKLDDDDAITEYIKKKRQEIRKKSQQGKEKNDTATVETEGVRSVFDEAFKNNLVNNLQDMYDSPQVSEDVDGSIFYEDSLEYLSKNLPSDSLVLAKYKKFKEEYPNPDRRDYFEELKKLIDDDL